MSTSCPKCHQSDQVQKVSSIVSDGVYDTSYGTARTELAQKLLINRSDIVWDKFIREHWMTKMVEYRKQFPPPEMGQTAKIALLLLWLSLCLGAVLTFVFSQVSGTIGIICAFSTAGSTLIALISSYNFMKSNQTVEYKEWQKKYDAARLQCEKEAQQIKQKTFHRWDNLYYCHRDDVVFLPNENLSSAPSEMMDLLMWK